MPGIPKNIVKFQYVICLKIILLLAPANGKTHTHSRKLAQLLVDCWLDFGNTNREFMLEYFIFLRYHQDYQYLLKKMGTSLQIFPSNNFK
jgi:hypothetical protein